MTLKEWLNAKPAHISLQQTTLQPQKAHLADDLETIIMLLWTWQTHVETVVHTTRGKCFTSSFNHSFTKNYTPSSEILSMFVLIY